MCFISHFANQNFQTESIASEIFYLQNMLYIQFEIFNLQNEKYKCSRKTHPKKLNGRSLTEQ